jgi:methionyl-tRNA synthetase
VKFSTGVDENSQKVIEKALEAELSLDDYCNMMAQKHKSLWDKLDISYTDFVRTTDLSHKRFVQQVLQKSYDNGDIYLGEYE